MAWVSITMKPNQNNFKLQRNVSILALGPYQCCIPLHQTIYPVACFIPYTPCRIIPSLQLHTFLLHHILTPVIFLLPSHSHSSYIHGPVRLLSLFHSLHMLGLFHPYCFLNDCGFGSGPGPSAGRLLNICIFILEGSLLAFLSPLLN